MFKYKFSLLVTVPQNIPIPPSPMEGQWKFQLEGEGGGRLAKAKVFKEKYRAKLEFPDWRGGGGRAANQ